LSPGLDSKSKLCNNGCMGHSRPTITDSHIVQIRSLISGNPDWNRTRLSMEICRFWGWQSANGQIKDLSCRDMLRDLDKAGAINLPPSQKAPRNAGWGADKVELLRHCTDSIDAPLRELVPLRFEIAASKSDAKEFKSYIAQYHYLKWDRAIGENLRYFVKSAGGAPLACIMYSSASWACHARDSYIGWSGEQRRAGLHYLTNQSRFLIFPWVRCPHLASHILAKSARMLSGDFQSKYGHPIHLIETYVERPRFRGVCYAAANWLRVGETTGRGRDSKSSKATLPIKDVWLLPLTNRARAKLCAAEGGRA